MKVQVWSRGSSSVNMEYMSLDVEEVGSASYLENCREGEEIMIIIQG